MSRPVSINVIIAAGLCCTAAFAGGCRRGPTLYPVSGAVRYQGQPVEAGQIFFADPTGAAPTAYGPIENGRYAIEVAAGAKQVRITATKETGKIIEGAMGANYPEVVDLIPPQYNAASTLTADVGPAGDKAIDFDLE